MKCGLTVPEGMDEQEYWETIMVSAVNDKYAYTKSNLIQALARQYKGEGCCGVIYYYTYNLNHTDDG